ncbi:MAG: phosphatase PAP2 family protein [Planctomycetes bacterium]|nr:phosphatase PAP2 family protein [Planctomycetota bacterium]
MAAVFVLLCGIAVILDSSWLQTMDESVLMAARESSEPSVPKGPAWLGELARDVTALGGYTLLTLISVTVWGLLRLERSRRHASWFAATAAGGYLLNFVLKHVVARPRPDLVTHLSFVDSPSFPSGHAMMSTVVFLAIGLMIREMVSRPAVRKLAVALPLLVAVAVGLTRVYLGVHYPSDVFAGLCCGVAWTSGCWRFWPGDNKDPSQVLSKPPMPRAA